MLTGYLVCCVAVLLCCVELDLRVGPTGAVCVAECAVFWCAVAECASVYVVTVLCCFVLGECF